MNKKTIIYEHVVEDTVDNTTTCTELWLDPNSEAYKMYKENRLGELDKHLETIMRKGK